MTIRIRNDSTSAVVRGYAVDSHNTLVWLELAPQHPKTIGAIWADQVVQQRPWLQLGDFDVAGSSQSHRSAVRAVCGLSSRYERLMAETPKYTSPILAIRANILFRLIILKSPESEQASLG